MSVGIEPAAHTVRVNKIAHETTPLGLSCLICSHLYKVKAFQSLVSSESNLEFLGPSKIIIMFYLKTGGSFSRLVVNNSPLHAKA
jgi:hypothetical protein